MSNEYSLDIFLFVIIMLLVYSYIPFLYFKLTKLNFICKEF